ncbi:hypothetical protein [Streptomyces sp. NRRL WC-3549]|uniref:hypothetical protein n=1 Tax=Streptomyces sp. NRRL WC-3549 TaxID=1463925 RepID=UPI00131DCC54|nr:hypothetical protein [Streptomyces sp. NRRL WC-3549]
MTVNIARHNLPQNAENQQHAERLSEGLIKDIDEIEESPDLIDFTFEHLPIEIGRMIANAEVVLHVTPDPNTDLPP